MGRSEDVVGACRLKSVWIVGMLTVWGQKACRQRVDLSHFVGQKCVEACLSNKCSLYISNDLSVLWESGVKTPFCTCR